MFQGRHWIRTPPCMNWGSLNHSAAWSDEPLKALTLRQLSDWSSVIATATDRWNCRQVCSNHIQVNLRIQRQHSRFIQLDPRLEERQSGTRNYHAGVDKLLAVHFWYNADYRIVIPELIENALPPQKSSDAHRVALSGIQR